MVFFRLSVRILFNTLRCDIILSDIQVIPKGNHGEWNYLKTKILCIIKKLIC